MIFVAPATILHDVGNGAGHVQVRRILVSSSDFRHIAIRTESGKGERLFRAAVSAFCSLPRPSRREIAQLEDLALPLFDGVSTDSLRFVAAALSECEYPPMALVRRLCALSVDIAAPLLIRSRALADIDLIALIGRHGLPHARAIARRKDLNPVIADLVRALEKPTLVPARNTDGSTVVPLPPPAATTQKTTPGKTAEAVRDELRAMMLARHEDKATPINPANRSSGIYARLRETALAGNAALFQTALADALGIDFAVARALTACPDYAPLLLALRALDLNEDKAFLIAVAAFPNRFPNPHAIRLFLDRYRLIERKDALDQVRRWKTGAESGIGQHGRHADAGAPATPRVGTGVRAS